jgi:hypothetical protein
MVARLEVTLKPLVKIAFNFFSQVFRAKPPKDAKRNTGWP